MAHFVGNIHNYIMVEVLESAWKIFFDELKQVKSLDELIAVMQRYSKSILNKALQSEAQKDLNRLLKRLLNNVYTFALIKERYFFKSAMDEIDRLQRIRIHTARGQPMTTLDQADQVSQINHESVEQLNRLHEDFYRNFQAFKENLDNREEQNFIYLRCRLDFNMYYANRLAAEAGGGDESDGDTLIEDHGVDDDEDIVDDDDEDEDEDLADEGEDDDDDDNM